MSNEKSIYTYFGEKYSHIKFPESFLKCWSSEAFEPLALPPQDERFESTDKAPYLEEASEKRRRTVQLNFTELKSAFNDDKALFSSFLLEFYAYLKEKHVPYISLEGFEDLAVEDQQNFVTFLNENPAVLDCPPCQPTTEETDSLARWPIAVECKIKKLQPFLARNTFLACYSEQEKNSKFKDDLWEQTAYLMVHGQGAHCSPQAFVFFPDTSNTPSQRVFQNNIDLMWGELFEPVVIYLKNKVVASSFTYSGHWVPTKNYLTIDGLKQLLKHIEELKFQTFSLKVNEGYANYPELFKVIALLLEKAPFECQSLQIDIAINDYNDKEISQLLKQLETCYRREQKITTALNVNFNSKSNLDHDNWQKLNSVCKTYNDSFSNLALANRREIIAEHPEKMKAVFAPPPTKPDSALWPGLQQQKIRRRKNPKITLQHAHQHHVVQQVQQQTQLQHSIRQNIISPVAQESNLLDKKTFLKQFDKYHKKEMEYVWDNICGREPSLTKIEWITPSANEQIKRFDYIYQGGLVQGTQSFSIAQKNGQWVLGFAPVTQAQPDPLLPLTPIPYLLYPELASYGTYRQFRKSEKKVYKDDFSIKYCDGYEDFGGMLGEGAVLLEKYKHIFEPYTEDKGGIMEHLAIKTGWSKLYARCGVKGLENLLEGLDKLYRINPKIFAQFRDNFLANSYDFSEFADTQSLAVIANIATFSPNQLHWWNTLVNEHQRYLPYCPDFIASSSRLSPINLIDLYEGFTTFLTQYLALARQNGIESPDLPPICHFKNARNLKTSLYRLLGILKNARNFSEQVQHLEGLDLGTEGAYYASQSNHFSFVHAAMQLSPFSRPALYAAKVNLSNSTSIEDLKKFFGVKVPAIIISNTRANGSFNKIGTTCFIFNGKTLTSLKRGMWWDEFGFESLEGSKKEDEIRCVRTLPDSLDYFFLKKGYFYTPSSNAGSDFLSYTVDDQLLIQKAFDDQFLFKSTDNSRDFIQLFYRALGSLKHTPPFQDIVQLVETIADTLKNQPENQKKLLCIVARSLRTKQNQPNVPIASCSQLLLRLKDTSKEVVSDRLEKALELTQESSFTLVAAADFLNGLAFNSKLLLTAVEAGDIFWNGLDIRGRYHNAIELELYLECFNQFKESKNLLPFLSIVDKGEFTIKKFKTFCNTFSKLSLGLQADLTYFWSILDSVASTAAGKNLPTIDQWLSLLDSFFENEIQDYVTFEKTLLERFPHLRLNVNIAATKVISIEDFLRKHLSTEEIAKYSPLFNDPQKLFTAIFNNLQVNNQNERLAMLFSQETLLNILSTQAIKRAHLNPSLKSQCLFLLTKKLAVGLSPEINSCYTLSRFFEYIDCCEDFLAVCQKLNPKVLDQLIPMLYQAKIAVHPQNLIDILWGILSGPHKKIFPIDLLKQFLACEDLTLFSRNNEASKQATLLINDIFSLTDLQNNKELFLKNFLDSIKAIHDHEKELFFTCLREFISRYQPNVLPEILNLWYHFNLNAAAGRSIIIFETLLPFIHSLPESLQINLLTYLKKHTPKNIETLLERLKKIHDKDNTLYAVLTILASFHHEKAEHSFPELLEMVEKLISAPDIVGVLATACKKVPSPSFKKLHQFFQSFQDGSPSYEDSEEFIKEFEVLPHGPRDLTKQFNTDQVLRVIKKMVDWQGKPLSYTKQKKLLDCFTFINVIGNDYPIFEGKSIRELSSVKMKQLWSQIQIIIRNQKSSSEQKLTARLIAIAVLRQVMERTSEGETKEPIFPDSTQILDLICANLNPGNAALEIPTGEGKSIVEAMQAAIFSLSGKSIVVFTPRLAIAERNRSQFERFFNYLDIQQANTVINEDSDLKSFIPGGIHYTSSSHFGLFKDKQALNSPEFLSDIFMIVSEFDRAATDLTHMRHSDVMDASAEDGKVSAIDWIYPLVYEFFEQGKIYENEINALKLFIENNITPEQREELKKLKISDERLARWLDAAKALSSLKENTHYVVTPVVENSVEGSKTFYRVSILEGEGELSQNAEYSRAIQQMLCARLNKQLDIKDPIKQLPRYRIAPEGVVTTLLTHKNLMNQASEKGQLFATTATLGSKQEIKQFITDFNLRTVIKVPHHQGDNRVREIFLDKDAKARAQHIVDTIAAYLEENPPPPILLRPKGIDEATAWYNLIQEKFANHPRMKTLQLYTGKDKQSYDCASKNTSFFSEKADKTIDEQVTEQAGVVGTITISTLMIRETDIQPRYALDLASEKYSPGLLTIQPYLTAYREQEQFAGRSGRRGMRGRSYLYVIEEELDRFEGMEGVIKPPISLPVEKRIKHAQSILQKQEAYKLKQHNIVGDYLRDLYQYFLPLYSQINDKEQRNNFHMQWIILLEELEDAWLDLLEENEINDNFADEEKLNKCIDEYLPLLQEGCQTITRAYFGLQSASNEIPTAPRFERKQSSPIASSMPEPIVIPTLSLPGHAETIQIHKHFISQVDKSFNIGLGSETLEKFSKSVQEKINSLIQTISRQLKVDLQPPVGNIEKALLMINQTLLNHYDFSELKITSKFKTCLALQDDLIHLLERLEDPQAQQAIVKQMSAHYLDGLQKNYPVDTTTPFFAYYTQLKSWESTFPWFKLSVPENRDEFKSQVIQSVIKELEPYNDAWGRSGDRVMAYDRLMLELSAQENDLVSVFMLLTAARERALITDVDINKERRESWISLKPRKLDDSRYQKLLDSAIARVVLALETQEKTWLNEEFKFHFTHLFTHLSALLPLSLSFDTAEKSLKKLRKNLVEVEKDHQSIVRILTQKSLLFSHINITSSQEKSIETPPDGNHSRKKME